MKVYIIILFIVIFICLYVRNRQEYKNNTIIRKSVNVRERLKILRELYDKIVTVSDSINTKLFLIYGTLLGKVRDNDLICYDYDLDFGIEDKDYDEIKKSLIAYFSKDKNYRIDVKDFLWYKSIEIIHNKTRLSADISSFSSTNKYTWRNVPSIYSIHVLKECDWKYPKNWVFPLIETEFLNKTIYIPNQSEKILECYYGKNFLTPDHVCNVDCTICKKK